MFNYFKASYWDFFELCSCKKRPPGYKFTNLKNAEKRRAELEGHDVNMFETKYIKPENFEAPDIALLELEKKRRFLKLEDLKKEYSTGFKAVDGINVRMYEGQIFALLGHNGAGKTTTIKMLTGMLSPSEGEAYVYGYKVFS
jgi:ABC-type glutathione transport system ATPase component